MSKRSKAWEGKQKEVWANREARHQRVVGSRIKGVWTEEISNPCTEIDADADHGIYNVDNNSIKIASLTYANEQLTQMISELKQRLDTALERLKVTDGRLFNMQESLAMATDEIITLKEQRDAAVRRAQEMEKQLYDMIGTEEW